MPRTRRKKAVNASKKTQPQPQRQPLISRLANALVFLALFLMFGIALSAVAYVLYLQGIIGSTNFQYISEAVSLLSLSIAVFTYLILFKKMGLRESLGHLGFIRKNLLRNLCLGLVIFAMILVLELVVALIGALINVQINTNVQMVFAGAPLWYYLFAAFIEPINEEIMFRGFMVPRIGIIPSAVIFGLLHYSYNSTFGIEMIAAAVFGLIAGYVFKKTKSIYPGIVAHIIINTIGVFAAMG